VTSVEASRGRVFAVVRRGATDEVVVSQANDAAWQLLLERPSSGPAPTLASVNGVAYVLAGSALTVVGDGPAVDLRSPCRDGEEGRLAVAGASIWVACRSASGEWSLHHSPDAGASFDRLPTTPAGLAGLDALASRTADELFTYTSAIGLARQKVGGKAAVVTRPGAAQPVRYVGFTTASVGFAVPATGGVWRTDDGGATWQEFSIFRPDEND
jgi:photosystem II stability/assembly factor-like uncharacterized protein